MIKLSETYINLSNLEMIDPTTVKSDEGDVIPLTTTEVVRAMNRGLLIGSPTFSRQLFRADKELWMELRDRKSIEEDAQEFIENYMLLVVDKHGVGVVESSKDLKDFIACIDELVEDSIEHDIDVSLGTITVKLKFTETTGVGIEYDLARNWMTIYSIYYTDSGIYVSHSKQVDKEVESDMVHLLDYEVISISSEYVSQEYSDFLEVSDTIHLTVDEIMRRLRSDLDVRVKIEEADTRDADKVLSTKSFQLLGSMIEKLYTTDARTYLQAPTLRRSVEFVDVTYFDYYQMLVYSHGNIPLEIFSEISRVVLTGVSNKAILD